MEQRIRFCTTADGIRIAYATVGTGPAFMVPPGWISHLELEWEQPALRAFFEAVARRHTVVRYDKYGCGLSDRDRTTFTLDQEVQDGREDDCGGLEKPHRSTPALISGLSAASSRTLVTPCRSSGGRGRGRCGDLGQHSS